MPRLSLRPLAAALPAALASVAHAQMAENTRAPDVVVQGRAPAEKLSLDVPVATGSRLNLTPRETPASVSVVDRDTIERRGAIDTQDILRSVPGITAAAPPGSAGSVFYRGFGAASLTQLFNGITVQYDAIAARPVDAWIYDRVEVIGGPSSFLYGAGAVGGAINYVTKLPVREADFGQARLSAGSYDTTQLALGLNRRLGDGEGVRNTARLDVNRSATNGFVDGNAREAWQVATSLLTDITPAVSHTLALEYQDERIERPYWGTPLLNPTLGDGAIRPDTRFENYNVRDGVYEQRVTWARSVLDVRLGEATTLRNTLYHYDAQRDYRNLEVYRFNALNTLVNRSAAFLQRHDQELTGNRLELTHAGHLGSLPSDWATGVDVSVNSQTRYPSSVNATFDSVNPVDFDPRGFYDVPGMTPGLRPDRTNRVQTVALFVENRTRLLPVLSLVTGLRHDRIDLEVFNQRTASATDPAYFQRVFEPTTGRLGLVWDVQPGAALYVQGSTAADPPAGILTTANFSQLRDFDLTTGRQVEAGGKFDVLDGRGAFTAAVYSITRKNLAVADPNNPGTTLPVGQQSSRGFELALALRVTRTVLAETNYAYTDAEFDQFTENVGGTAVSRAGNRPPNIPVHVANLWLAWDFARDWQLGGDARYVGGRYGNNANTVSDGDYTLFGGFLAWRGIRSTTITGRVRNLTDEVYAANITGTPMFWLGMPRTFEIAVQTTF
jgi:iron complex outermembrane receptor protein